MNLPLFREWIKTVGALPLLLVTLGAILFFRHSRSWWVPTWAGILWIGYNVLFAKREISTTVGIDPGEVQTWTRSDGTTTTFTGE